MSHEEQIIDVLQDCFQIARQEVCMRDASAEDFKLLVQASARIVASEAYESHFCCDDRNHDALVQLFNTHLLEALRDHAAMAARQLPLI